MECAICGRPLEHLNESERQDHYDIHFSEDEPREAGTSASADLAAIQPSKSKEELDIKEEIGQFWGIIQDPKIKKPSNFTPGLIPILRKVLRHSHYKGMTRRAALCHEGVWHIASQFLDTTYGCG
jgi:hypothetical protein